MLRSYERGEADRVFALFTKEFGLVWARCSAVRRESSRMRYAVQNYAHANVSLVRGNRGWRLAGATSLEHFDAANVRGVRIFARVASLVERLVRGEERNEYLFASLAEAHAALMRESKESHGAIELLCVARVLYALGYISVEAFDTGHASFSAENVRDPASPRQAPALRRGPTPISLGTALFTHTAYTLPELTEAEAARSKLLTSVNKALSETHL